MPKLPLVAAALSLAGAVLQAQGSGCGGLTASVVPNPAPYGEVVKATLTNPTTSIITLPETCVIRTIHEGGPDGPAITGFGCLTAPAPIFPGGSLEQLWNQETDEGVQVEPGLYTLKFNTPLGAGPCELSLVIDPCPAGQITTFGSGCGTGRCGIFDFGPLVLNVKSCPLPGTDLALQLLSLIHI